MIMQILLFTAVFFIAYSEASWRYYTTEHHQWNPQQGQHFHPPGQPFNPTYQGNINSHSGHPSFGSNPWFQHEPTENFIQNALRGAEWICRNPQTGNMVILSPDEENPTKPGNGPQRPQWHQPQQPPWHHPQQPSRPGQIPSHQHPTANSETQTDQSSNPWNNPLFNGNTGNSAPQRPTTETTSSPPQRSVTHGGEGLIDIRIGE